MTGNLMSALSASSDDTLAVIVGPNQFQNALLAACFETHGGWKSTVADSMGAIPPFQGSVIPPRVAVLFDCFGLGGDTLAATLPSDLDRLPPGCALTLFNLDREAGIEKRALQYGVQGFFYRDDPVETLLRGVAAVFSGEFWVSRQKMAEVLLENSCELRRRLIPCHDYPHDLTRREVEILGLLSHGAANEAIADKLFISPHTVRTHLNHIFKKINASSRLEASVWAAETLFARMHK